MTPKSSTLKLNLMSLPKLPQPDETWPASALAAHQVMSAHIEKMSEQLEKLTSTVDELQRQLKLNSKTSSKPPSSDRERRPAKKKKKKTGRARGAQKGAHVYCLSLMR